MSLEAVDFLVSQKAQEELRLLKPAGEPLRILEGLRRRWSADEAAWLYDQALLRRRAAAKFSEADLMLFEGEALEQASSEAVAAWRARELLAPYESVADLGSGIGGDAIAFARAGKEVLAVEKNPLRAAILRYNVAALGLSERVSVVEADWRDLSFEQRVVFADPARRKQGRRSVRLRDMEPPFEDVLALSERVEGLLVKLAPALDKDEVPAGASLGFVSLRGELKEALVGLGSLARKTTWAVALPAQACLQGPEAPAAAVSAPRSFIYEPDPAVIRAGLLHKLAARLGAAQINERVAYLSGDECRNDPLAGCWRILRHAPYRLKTLRGWLNELGPASLDVKRRHNPVDPQELLKRLPQEGGGRRLTLFLTRLRGEPWMILAEKPQS